MSESALPDNVLGRVRKIRKQGKITFLEVTRMDGVSMQCVCVGSAKSQADNLSNHSVIEMIGNMVESLVRVDSVDIHDREFVVLGLSVVSTASELPIQPSDVCLNDGDGVHRHNRYDNRVLDLRAPRNREIMRNKSKIVRGFCAHLDDLGFSQIFTPKLLGTPSEGGCEVFELDYFNQKAYLSQSPQLHKQMAICADIGNVYEVAPAFRAESSLSKRHLTEFISLDLEMRLTVMSDLIELIDDLLLNMSLRMDGKAPFPRITYPEAIQMLQDRGIDIGPLDSMSGEHEKLLGRVVKENTGSDVFYLLYFPKTQRPFYTHPYRDGLVGKLPKLNAPSDHYSLGFDVIFKGREISSGAMRIHNYDDLIEECNNRGMKCELLRDYLDSFKYGVYPHGGCAFGLERLITLSENLENIRDGSMFPRDPERLRP